MTAVIRKHFTRCADWYVFIGAVAAWLWLLAAVLTNEGWMR